MIKRNFYQVTLADPHAPQKPVYWKKSKIKKIELKWYKKQEKNCRNLIS